MRPEHSLLLFSCTIPELLCVVLVSVEDNRSRFLSAMWLFVTQLVVSKYWPELSVLINIRGICIGSCCSGDSECLMHSHHPMCCLWPQCLSDNDSVMSLWHQCMYTHM